MKLGAIVFSFVLTFTFTSSYKGLSEKEYLDVTQECIEKEKVPPALAIKIANFDFPDEPIVRKLLYCTWTKMEFWDDTKGYDLDRIAAIYSNRGTPEELYPILTNCNSNEQNSPTDVWFYRGFKCLYGSRLGDWFRSDVKKYIAQQALPV